MDDKTKVVGVTQADKDERLGEALFAMSAQLKASGFLADSAHRSVYERVVAAFNLPVVSQEAIAATTGEVERAASLMFESGGHGRPWKQCGPELQERYRGAATKFLATLSPTPERGDVEQRATEMLCDLIGPQFSDTTLRVATDWLKQEQRLALLHRRTGE